MGTAGTRILASALISVVVALVLLAIVRNTIPADTLDDHNEVAAAVYAGLGVIFGVMLAQLVVASWNDYQSARAASFREAAALRNIVHLADGFTRSQREEILQTTEKYIKAVLDTEWPQLQQGDRPSPTAEQAIHVLFRIYADVDMASERGSPYLDASIRKLGELSDARAERLAAHGSRLPRFVWAVLIFLAVPIVGFIPFFGVGDWHAHVGLTVVIALTVPLLLMLVWVLDNPFYPPAGIPSGDFEDVLERIRSELAPEDGRHSP